VADGFQQTRPQADEEAGAEGGDDQGASGASPPSSAGCGVIDASIEASRAVSTPACWPSGLAATAPERAWLGGGGGVVGWSIGGPGWVRWALAVAGLALGIALVAWLWPDDASTPTARKAGPTAAPATGASATTASGSTAPPGPSASGVNTALANLTAVITAARQQGTVDQEAEDLLHQADDLANALQQEDPKDQDKDKSKDEGKGRGNGKGGDAAKKVAELEGKVNELISQGKIRPPATTEIQQAVAQLALAVQQAG
jgi:hypothetical protein